MSRRFFIIGLSIMFICSIQLFSHGIDHFSISGGIGIEAQYDSGYPVAKVEVKVFSPADSQVPFQKGYSDKNGRFMFKPDTEGDWTIIFNDGTGHGFKTKLHIDKSKKNSENPVHNEPVPLLYKILMGISIIFGLTGILLFFTSKKEEKR